jgi:hypothetical protein
LTIDSAILSGPVPRSLLYLPSRHFQKIIVIRLTILILPGLGHPTTEKQFLC